MIKHRACPYSDYASVPPLRYDAPMALGGSEARVFRCCQCGTPLHVDPRYPAARCSGCNAVVPIPEAVRAEAYSYMQRVNVAEHAINEDAKIIGQLAGRTSSVATRTSKRWGTAVWVVIAATLVLSLIGAVLEHQGGGAKDDVSRGLLLAAYVLFGLFYVVIIGYGMSYASRKAKAPKLSAAPVAEQACPRCGSSLRFLPGQTTATCPACSATALPSKNVVQALARSVEDEAHRVNTERGRAIRANFRVRLSHSITASTASAYGIGGTLALGCVMGIIGFFNTNDPQEARNFLGISVGSLAVGALSALLYFVFTIRPRRRMGEALRAFADRTRGYWSVSRPIESLDWLDTYWQGDTPLDPMVVGPRQMRWMITGCLNGLPTMAVVFLGSPGSSYGCGVPLTLYIASPRPRPPSVSPSPALAELHRLRFTGVQPSYAGLILSRSYITLAEVRRGLVDRAFQLGVELAAQRP